MLSGRDIILISSIEWEFNWQGHQEIASRLARAGNRVLYVENMGVRSPGLYVCSPLILPPFGSSTRHRLNRHLLLPLVLRAARSLRFEQDVIWTFLPTDTVATLVRMLSKPRGVVVYYCITQSENTGHRSCS